MGLVDVGVDVGVTSTIGAGCSGTGVEGIDGLAPQADNDSTTNGRVR